MCHISDNLFHTFLHSPSLASVLVRLVELSLSFPSFLFDSLAGRGTRLLPCPRRILLNILSSVAAHRTVLPIPPSSLHPLREPTLRLAMFRVRGSLSRAGRLSLSIGPTNQRAWSSGHDAGRAESRPTGLRTHEQSVSKLRGVRLAGARATPNVSMRVTTRIHASRSLLQRLLIFISGPINILK